MNKNLILIAGGFFVAALGILGIMSKKKTTAPASAVQPVPSFAPDAIGPVQQQG